MPAVLSAVKALIVQDDHFLFLKQSVLGEEFWDLPGGRIEFGESPYNTLLREVKEETTLSIEIVRPVGLWWFFRKIDGDQVICSTFLCSIQKGDVRLDLNPTQESISQAEWIPTSRIVDGTFDSGYESLRQLLERYLMNKNVVHI